MDLTPALQTFHGAFGNEGPLAYIVFGGFWEDQPTVADDYLLTLDLIRSTANALIVIGVPRVSHVSNCKSHLAKSAPMLVFGP